MKSRYALNLRIKVLFIVQSSLMWMSDASMPIMGQYKCRSSYDSKFSKAECDARDGSLHLKTKFEYWHQIQGQHHLKDTQCCDLLVWIPSDTQIIHIDKDVLWSTF
ncbi:uncharacterized protein LOC130053956 isoform X2 [Ostrea edulis]|uniref:uncharacterized protein LOC130053956 isoform X2 n=1 Tax=Ostrea edulis TaxID=37623 RepID=UPI0024AF4633|nr:uncharacterized protein LOC130053956 isoform X2 [Ostrea edulis]